MQWQLAENPPADRLIASYFIGQKWWEPPRRGAGRADLAAEEAGEWECPLPDVTD